MGSDGFQTQRNKSWVSGQVRAERVLAEVTTDGRKEWACKFCSESNVWTRWRCRRCYHNILASLHRKFEQAIAAKSGDWSTGSSGSSGEEERKARSLEAENQELRARIEAVGTKEGMMPSVAENWMIRGKRCRGSYERSKDCLSLQRKCKRTSWSHCSINCKRFRKKRNDLMPEHQRLQKRSQKIHSIQEREEYAERELRGKRRNAENQRRN